MPLLRLTGRNVMIDVDVQRGSAAALCVWGRWAVEPNKKCPRRVEAVVDALDRDKHTQGDLTPLHVGLGLVVRRLASQGDDDCHRGSRDPHNDPLVVGLGRDDRRVWLWYCARIRRRGLP